MNTENIKKVLEFDAFKEAENLTGKSYKEDKLTETLGFLAHIENGNQKRDLLNSLGDSTFSNTEDDYIRIVKSIGFESVLVEPFTNESEIEERLHVMWNKYYSILLVFDTHTWGDDGSWEKSGQKVPPPNVNGGNFYYNWAPNIDCENRFTSSGSYSSNGDSNKTYNTLFNSDFTPHVLPNELRTIEPTIDWENYNEYKNAFERWCIKVNSYITSKNLIKIWKGNHDCREAIKFNINQLIENGKFVTKWKEDQFLWLLHYMDTKVDGYDHNKITKERLNKLPTHVLKSINI